MEVGLRGSAQSHPGSSTALAGCLIILIPAQGSSKTCISTQYMSVVLCVNLCLALFSFPYFLQLVLFTKLVLNFIVVLNLLIIILLSILSQTRALGP